MASLDNFAIIHISDDQHLTPANITTELGNLRHVINRKFYSNLKISAQEQLHNFMWGPLHDLWRDGAPQVRIAASTTVSHILIRLAPFYADPFMATLRDAITNTTDESLYYLSCFCYLSKFFSTYSLNEILEETPIFHLFGAADSEYLPQIVGQLLHLPHEFLLTLAEFFISLTKKDRNNRHLPRAAATIISTNPNEFTILIEDDVPLFIIIAMFSESLPKLQEHQLSSLKQRTINHITATKPDYSEYEAACKILSNLVDSQQICADELKEIITQEMIDKSPSLNSLLLLPIKPEIIQTMFTFSVDQMSNSLDELSSFDSGSYDSGSGFGSPSPLPSVSSILSPISDSANNTPDSPTTPSSGSIVRSNTMSSFFATPPRNQKIKKNKTIHVSRNHIQPLLIYFSRNSEFTSELIDLIKITLDQSSEFYSAGITTLTSVANNLPNEAINELLMQVMEQESNNWIHQLWTLNLLAKINFRHLTREVSDKAFEIIDDAAISKSDKLHEAAKEITVQLFDTVQTEIFNLFIDRFTRKMDIFDRQNFERRLSFLAYVFKNTHGGWTISFLSLANHLMEINTLFDLSSIAMIDIFSIISILAQNLRDPIILTFFIKQAMDIIEQSYIDFTGEKIGTNRPQIFDSPNPRTYPLSKFECDLTSNPSSWHTQIISCAAAAFSFLVRVQWGSYKIDEKTNVMNYDTLSYLFFMTTKLLPLFTADANLMTISLLNVSNVSYYNIEQFIQFSLKFSRSKNDILALARLLSISCDRFHDEMKPEDFEFQELSHTLDLMFPHCLDLDFITVLAVKKFYSFIKLPLGDDICLKVVKPSQRHILLSSGSVSATSIRREDNELLEAAELYDQDSEDEIESSVQPSEFNFLDENDLPMHFSSISPFINMKMEIPQSLMKKSLLLQFFQYSSSKLTEEQANSFMKTFIEQDSAKCLYYLIRYCTRIKVNLDLKKQLILPQFSYRSIFAAVIAHVTPAVKSFDDASQELLNYIRSFTGQNLADFLLKTEGLSRKLIGLSIFRFDPHECLKEILKKGTYKFHDIFNLCYYVQQSKVPPNEFFSLATVVVKQNAASRKKRNISRRLMSIFLSMCPPIKPIFTGALADLPLSNDLLKKITAAELVEISYELMALAPGINCDLISSLLAKVFGKATPYGASLSILYVPPTPEQIQTFLNSPLASVYLLPIKYFIGKFQLTPKMSFPTSASDVILQAKRQKTSITSSYMLSFITSMLSISSLQKSQAKSAFHYINNELEIKSAHINKICKIYDILLDIFDYKSSETKHIVSFTDALFDAPIVSVQAPDLLVKVSVKIKDISHVAKIMSPHLRTYSSYQSCYLAELAAIFNMKANDIKSGDVISFMQMAKTFFPTFYAVASAEKKCSQLRHDKLIGLFQHPHNESLVMLNDPYLKPISPQFAMLNAMDSIPEPLQNLITTIEEKKGSKLSK